MLSSSATAQFRIGVRGGFNSASIDNLENIGINNLSDLDDVPGFQFSTVFEIGIGNAFSIQPELGFIRQGIDFSNKLDSANIYNFHKLILDYLQVPLMGKASFGKGKVKPYLNVGPSLGYLVNAIDVKEINGSDEEEELDLDNAFKDVINRVDLSLNLGGGVAVKLGPGNLLLDFRYDMPLNDFITNVQDQNLDALRGKEYSVSLAYLIQIGGSK